MEIQPGQNREKIHWGFYLPEIKIGGAEYLNLVLVEGLVKKGHKVTIFCDKIENDFMLNRVRKLDNLSIVINNKSKLAILKSILKSIIYFCLHYQKNLSLSVLIYILYKQLGSSFSSNDPDDVNILVGCTNSSISRIIMVSLCSNRNIYLIQQYNNYPDHDNQKKTFSRSLKYFSERINLIITPSQKCSQAIMKTHNISRCTTIYSPVYRKEIEQKAAQKPSHRWLDHKDIPVILNVGLICRRKGQEELIRAFQKVVAVRPARLILLGPHVHFGKVGFKNFGKYLQYRRIVALCKALGVEDHVDLCRQIENPYAFMGKADLFVLSSKNEGLPTVLIEAMACGCPVVSTDCASGPDEILADGTYGPLVPVGDIDALAEAMLATLDDPLPRQKLIERAKFFSIARAVTAYEDVAFDAIKHRREARQE